MFIDVLIALCFDVNVRFSRALRPLLLIFFIRKLRQMIVTIIRTLPHILDVSLLIFVLMIIYAIIALQLYALDSDLYLLCNECELIVIDTPMENYLKILTICQMLCSPYLFYLQRKITPQSC